MNRKLMMEGDRLCTEREREREREREIEREVGEGLLQVLAVTPFRVTERWL